jgi:RNA polymerase sigma-70 factor (ECF subfamily)
MSLTSRSTAVGAYTANIQEHNGVDRPVHEGAADGLLSASVSDGILLARICRRDEQALSLLYDRYARRVYTIALRIIQDRMVAEEVVQDVFHAAWQSAGSFRLGGNMTAWLLGITRYRAIDAMRARGYRLHAHTVAFHDANVAQSSRQIDGRADALTVRAALQALPTKQREAIELAYYDGLTRSVIAACLGEPVGTISSRLRLGLSRLRQSLHDVMEDSG